MAIFFTIIKHCYCVHRSTMIYRVAIYLASACIQLLLTSNIIVKSYHRGCYKQKRASTAKESVNGTWEAVAHRLLFFKNNKKMSATNMFSFLRCIESLDASSCRETQILSEHLTLDCKRRSVHCRRLTHVNVVCLCLIC